MFALFCYLMWFGGLPLQTIRSWNFAVSLCSQDNNKKTFIAHRCKWGYVHMLWSQYVNMSDLKKDTNSRFWNNKSHPWRPVMHPVYFDLSDKSLPGVINNFGLRLWWPRGAVCNLSHLYCSCYISARSLLQQTQVNIWYMYVHRVTAITAQRE